MPLKKDTIEAGDIFIWDLMKRFYERMNFDNNWTYTFYPTFIW